MQLHELSTPCALVDLDRVERNISRFSTKAKNLGVRLRPHVKTHKCIEVARLQAQHHAGGITVSTMAEARFFGDAGFDDIIYAVPIAPHRLDAALNLEEQLQSFAVLVDHTEVIDLAEAAAHARDLHLDIYLEIDCGGQRSGVDPAGGRHVDLARRIEASTSLKLRGLFTHAGQSYSCRTWPEVKDVADHERQIMVEVAHQLRHARITPGVISIGSTPTFAAVENLEGIDEVRPGNFVFFDAFQAALGSCSINEIAFSVLVTVLGEYPHRNELVIDGGALALSKDNGPIHIDPHCGYGIVASVDDSQALAGLKIVSLTQEHGIVRADSRDGLAGLKPGSRLRIFPNHSCLAAALYDRYSVSRGTTVVDEWRPVRGW